MQTDAQTLPVIEWLGNARAEAIEARCPGAIAAGIQLASQAGPAYSPGRAAIRAIQVAGLTPTAADLAKLAQPAPAPAPVVPTPTPAPSTGGIHIHEQ